MMWAGSITSRAGTVRMSQSCFEVPQRLNVPMNSNLWSSVAVHTVGTRIGSIVAEAFPGALTIL